MAIAETARLVASLELVDKFSKPIGNIERSMGRLEKSSSILRRGLGTALGIGIARASAATIGLGKSVITTAISFEEAYAGVRKTVEATDAELDALQQSFRDSAKETGIAFEELSRIGQIAGALGVATDAIDEFALATAKASTATGLTVDELADSLGRIGNILKLDESTYETFLSTLVELGNKGASTEGEILEITKRFAATGKQAGLTVDQILGLSSAIAGLGVEPEAAGSALSRIMSNFITETADGSKKAKEFAKVAGVSFKDFAETVRTDTLGAVLDFAEGLNGLSKFQRFEALKEAGITNVRDRNAVLLFAGAIDEVRTQLGLANDEFGKTNALSEEFRKRQETTAAQLAIVKANLRDVAFTIGSAVLPKIKELSTEFLGFVNQPDTQRAIKDFAAEIPGVVDSLVGIARDIPWAAIGSAATLMGTGAKALLSAFEALPSWVQTAVLTGWGFNQISGGALSKVFGNLTGELLGRVTGGLLGARGGSPLTPVYTKEVGLPSAGTPGGPGGGGIWRTLGGVFGLAAAAIIAAEVGSEMGKQTKSAKDAFNASGAGFLGLEGFFGGKDRAQGAATPLGQFTPANAGGVVPVKVVEGGGAFRATEAGIRVLRDQVRTSLKENDIHAARMADEQRQALLRLAGRVDRATNTVVPKIGETNRALSTANRNLQDGNARQRETAARIAEARDRIGTGFTSMGGKLDTIAAKDYNPQITVTVPVSNYVSISEVMRATSSTTFSSGFSKYGPNGPP